MKILPRASALRYVYLHGFASSPMASKATDLHQWFNENLHLSLDIPDLNLPNFRQQTLTRIVNYVEQMLVKSNNIWCLIGSSFGGLTATLVTQRQPSRIHSILLLAPAFDPVRIWKTNRNIDQWKIDGFLNHFNPSTQKDEPVDYEFFQDLQTHSAYPLVTSCPISIIHGIHDEVVPIEHSRAYYRQLRTLSRTPLEFIDIDDDHHLRKEKTLNKIKEVILRNHRS